MIRLHGRITASAGRSPYSMPQAFPEVRAEAGSRQPMSLNESTIRGPWTVSLNLTRIGLF